MWEPQASASGRVYQLTEASVLIASLHSHPPVQPHKGTTRLVMQIPYLRAHVSVFSIAKKKKNPFCNDPNTVVFTKKFNVIS